MSNTIDLQTAQEWAAKWRKEEGTYFEHYKVNAFNIPLEDLTQLLKEPLDGVRAYLGVNDDNTAKLMLVGTTYDADTDTFYDMLPKEAKTKKQGEIYDFTNPCPPGCDPTSPLTKL